MEAAFLGYTDPVGTGTKMCGACEPVSRILSSSAGRRVPREGDHHLSGTPVAGHLEQPTRTAVRRAAISTRKEDLSNRAVLLGLAPRGVCLAAPVTRERRCALTAPFHPLPVPRPKAQSSAGLLSVARAIPESAAHPVGCANRGLPVRKHGALWCSDFPHRRRRPTERQSGPHAESPASRARQAPLVYFI